MPTDTLHIAFVHPDLGIGGAERLIVDAASELAAAGHSVDVYTAHYNANRCFSETKSGLFSIRVAGSWFPRSLFGGRCIALCAYLRCLLAALALVRASNRSDNPYDVVIVDQVSIVVPIVKWFTTAKVLFYCHFPDLLLSKRPSLLHRMYRAPLDYLEQTTTGMADCLAVNSTYTQGVFAQTFTRLNARGVVPEVVYPAVQIPDDQAVQNGARFWEHQLPPDIARMMSERPTFLSINRFECKKNIQLAIQALHEVHQEQCRAAASMTSQQVAQSPGLVITGGYDVRLPENVQYYEQLLTLAAELDLEGNIIFLRSCTDRQKELLLSACTAVLYTPPLEHFGIVPLEAMAWGKAVVACNSGGPKESVVDGQTGLLCEATPKAFAAAMEALLVHGKADELGSQARAHVQQQFSREAFGVRLMDLLYCMVEEDIGSNASG